jgi:hypothetical protein
MQPTEVVWGRHLLLNERSLNLFSVVALAAIFFLFLFFFYFSLIVFFVFLGGVSGRQRTRLCCRHREEQTRRTCLLGWRNPFQLGTKKSSVIRSVSCRPTAERYPAPPAFISRKEKVKEKGKAVMEMEACFFFHLSPSAAVGSWNAHHLEGIVREEM